MVASTPASLSKGGSMHQKQPPANVATAWPGGTVTVTEAAKAAAANSIASRAKSRRFIVFLSNVDRT